MKRQKRYFRGKKFNQTNFYYGDLDKIDENGELRLKIKDHPRKIGGP